MTGDQYRQELMLPFRKVASVDPKSFVHNRAVLIGDVHLGPHSSVWPNAVIRADLNKIVIGRYTNIQDNTVIHASRESNVILGDFVTVGHSCVLHGCKIGNKVMIGLHSSILDGVEIEDNTIIGAHTLLTQKMHIPKHSLVMGSPGTVSKKRNPSKLFVIYAKMYWQLADQYQSFEIG